MKNLYLVFGLLLASLSTWSQVTISPYPFGADQEITITVDTGNMDTGCNGLAGAAKVYLHAGVGTDTDPWGLGVVGNWGQDDGVGEMTPQGGGLWTISLVPKTYFNLDDAQAASASKMGMVLRNASGTLELKDTGCTDFIVDLGRFQMQLDSPVSGLTRLDPGQSLTIAASSSLEADFTLTINGSIVDTALGVTDYQYVHANIVENSHYTLEATNGGDNQVQTFMTVVQVEEQPVPDGMLDGINLDAADPSTATLVLYAPGKEVVHLIGDFNGWAPDNAHLMKRDPARDRFWIELSGLTPQYDHSYQYLVDGAIRIADPYSTLILDPDQDQYIDALTYPGLPAYPTGLTQHAVTVLRTGEQPFAWANPVYSLPSKTDLVIYELLVRDFDALHSFDAVRNRLDYLQGLGVNAIELMPVSEFDGNESWGYNPSFHMALDKYYGTATALKQLVDECHRRGMAVILDVVLNHASGQNPYYRLWNTEGGGYGGKATMDNPFFNVEPTHAYNVFNDMDHSAQATRDYVKRVSQYWIEEYQLDGFRWDLTKGFTQNCPANDEGCTGSYQADRVEVLKEYADYQWEVNDDFLVIFEHLGTVEEETQWAEYRLDEGKGILLWNNLNVPYNEATMGWKENSDFSMVSHWAHQWATPANIAYMESHDEERLMFKNLAYGNASGDYNIQELSTALDRLELAGAFYFTVPGPKMIWQFGELGYQHSIELNGRTGNKPIHWEYYDDPDRRAVYDTWANLNRLAVGEPIFETAEFSLDVDDASGLKTLHLTDPSASGDAIGHVAIVGNFGVVEQAIDPGFQETGVWYEFLEGNRKHAVLDVNAPLLLAPGEYRIFGNRPSALFPDTNPPDADSDGVLDAHDLCPDTVLGATVDVDGCELFSLPADNFTILVEGATCRGENNGSIRVTAQQALAYTATLSGTSDAQMAFDQSVDFEGLGPGSYRLCITLASAPGYSQCHDLVLTEPEALEVQSQLDRGTNILSLQLKGADTYRVRINETTFLASKGSIDLKLDQAVNKILVSTDLDCQGVFAQTLVLTDRAMAYPNPLMEGHRLSIDLGWDTDALLKVKVYDLGGRLLQAKNDHARYGKLDLDLSALSQGMYVVKVTGPESEHEFKIVRQ